MFAVQKSAFVFIQGAGAASEPGSDSGADGGVRGQTPWRIQKDLSQKRRRKVRQILQAQPLAIPGDHSV